MEIKETKQYCCILYIAYISLLFAQDYGLVKVKLLKQYICTFKNIFY